jgi:hypothetical protein
MPFLKWWRKVLMRYWLKRYCHLLQTNSSRV